MLLDRHYISLGLFKFYLLKLVNRVSFIIQGILKVTVEQCWNKLANFSNFDNVTSLRI